MVSKVYSYSEEARGSNPWCENCQQKHSC